MSSRRLLAILASVLVVSALPGCTASQPPQPTVAVSSSTSPTLPLDSAGRGSLDTVTVAPSSDYAGVSGSPDALARRRYSQRADIGIPAAPIRGVPAKLVVPMWYGRATTFGLGEPGRRGSVTPTESLVAAAARKGFAWWAGPWAITYHIENGYFVIDGAIAKSISRH